MTELGGSPPAVEMTPEGVRAEVGRVMGDAAHPHHAGWTRGDQPAKDYVQGLYEKLHGKGTVAVGEGLSIGGPATPQEGQSPESAEEAKRNEVILAPLKSEWGPNFEANFAAARGEARELFTGEDGVVQPQVFEDLGSRIRTLYGPKGEALAIKFLADLGKLRRG